MKGPLEEIEGRVLDNRGDVGYDGYIEAVTSALEKLAKNAGFSYSSKDIKPYAAYVYARLDFVNCGCGKVVESRQIPVTRQALTASHRPLKNSLPHWRHLVEQALSKATERETRIRAEAKQTRIQSRAALQRPGRTAATPARVGNIKNRFARLALEDSSSDEEEAEQADAAPGPAGGRYG